MNQQERRRRLKEAVFELIQNPDQPGREEGPDALLKRLEHVVLQNGGGDAAIAALPSRATITRWKREFRGLPESEQAEFEHVRWPETFEAGLLPWESARYLLDLLAELQSRGAKTRVSVNFGRWLWRLHLASPSIPLLAAVSNAITLMLYEHADDISRTHIRRWVEANVAHQPWLGPEARDRLRSVEESGILPTTDDDWLGGPKPVFDEDGRVRDQATLDFLGHMTLLDWLEDDEEPADA